MHEDALSGVADFAEGLSKLATLSESTSTGLSKIARIATGTERAQPP